MTELDGWVGVFRELLDSPKWLNSTPEHKCILVAIILLANHEENKWEWQGKTFKVKPGQFVTSIDTLRKRAGKGVSTQNVRSALKRFEKLQFLTCKATKTGRVITICNWDKWRDKQKSSNIESNKDVTKVQQRCNKAVTPNKNDKNDNNDKKEPKPIAKFVPPSIEQIQKHIDEKGYTFSAEAFHAHYDSNGWMIGKSKMKKWKAACVTWKLNQKENATSFTPPDISAEEYESGIAKK